MPFQQVSQGRRGIGNYCRKYVGKGDCQGKQSLICSLVWKVITLYRVVLRCEPQWSLSRCLFFAPTIHSRSVIEWLTMRESWNSESNCEFALGDLVLKFEALVFDRALFSYCLPPCAERIRLQAKITTNSSETTEGYETTDGYETAAIHYVRNYSYRMQVILAILNLDQCLCNFQGR